MSRKREIITRKGKDYQPVRDACGKFSAGSCRTHGESTAREYRCWITMKGRCFNPKNSGYKDYGARGITVCKRWMVFETFLKDMGRKPSPKHTIERLNYNGNYTPKNCVWATVKEQTRNKRDTHRVMFNGAKMSLAEAVEKSSAPVPYNTVLYRLRRGWKIDDALALASQPGVRP